MDTIYEHTCVCARLYVCVYESMFVYQYVCLYVCLLEVADIDVHNVYCVLLAYDGATSGS